MTIVGLVGKPAVYTYMYMQGRQQGEAWLWLGGVCWPHRDPPRHETEAAVEEGLCGVAVEADAPPARPLREVDLCIHAQV